MRRGVEGRGGERRGRECRSGGERIGEEGIEKEGSGGEERGEEEGSREEEQHSTRLSSPLTQDGEGDGENGRREQRVKEKDCRRGKKASGEVGLWRRDEESLCLVCGLI